MLEDRVLEILGRSAMSYDRLLHELKANPGELDQALSQLGRRILRQDGRFFINGRQSQPPTIAAADTKTPPPAQEIQTMSDKKTCSICGEEKSADLFAAVGRQCKACLAERAKARYQKKHGAPAKASPAKKRRKAPSHAPASDGAGGRLVILELPDGVRIGTLVESGAIMKMRSHIDITLEQLDELVTWRQEQLG